GRFPARCGMPIQSSQRSTREIILLIVALLMVGGICSGLYYWLHTTTLQIDPKGTWTPERIGRLLLGPEQISCYCFFTWACLILLRRELEVRRQRSAFHLDLLPVEEGARILPEDARPLLRKLDMNTAQRGPLILASMVRMALGKYAMSRSAPDVGEVVRT